MMASKVPFEKAYLGNTDPRVIEGEAQPADPSLTKKFVEGFMTLMAAAGNDPAKIDPAALQAMVPTTTRTDLKIYDDEVAPEKSGKQRFIDALVPLGAALIGGMTGGNSAALAGAAGGLGAMKDQEDLDAAARRKVTEKKEGIRSEVIMRKILKDAKLDGSSDSVNKGRYMWNIMLDKNTGDPYLLRLDRQGGSPSMTTLNGDPVIPAGGVNAWEKFQPYGKPMGGDSADSPPPEVLVNPTTGRSWVETDTKPKDAKGSVGGRVKSAPNIASGPQPPSGGGISTPARHLPPAVKAPGGSAAGGLLPTGKKTEGEPNISAMSAPLPGANVEYPRRLEIIKKELDQNLENFNAALAEARRDKDRTRRTTPNGRLESPGDISARVDDAIKREDRIVADIAKAKTDAGKAKEDLEKEWALAKQKDAEEAKKDEKDKKPKEKDERSQKEAQYRYNILHKNLNDLESLVKEHGAFDIVGPEGDRMDSLIYQVAIDFAKLVDPESVAREGEVAAAQKYMMTFRANKGAFRSKETAVSLIKSYKTDLDRRLKARGEAYQVAAGTGGGERTLIKKQHNKAQNKTKYVYSDGTEEVVDGIK